MRSLHTTLSNSPYSETYLTLSKQIRVKHLIHGGIEYYYAGLSPEQLKSAGIEDRLSPVSVERSLANIKIGLETIANKDWSFDKVYINPHARPPVNGEKAREAAWVFNIYYDCELSAAIGMNFHYENCTIIGTIANIQGHDKERISRLRQTYEAPWAVVCLKSILEKLPPDISVIRGVPAWKHPYSGCEGLGLHQASNMYDRTFRNSNINMQPVRDPEGKVEYYQKNR
jgi:hypothetical protein